MACIRFLWLRRGPSGGVCSVPWNAWKSVSQKGLCSMIWFIYFPHQIWKERTCIHAQVNMICVSKVCNCYTRTRYLDGKRSHQVFDCVCNITGPPALIRISLFYVRMVH
jgi:hypothetical protein